MVCKKYIKITCIPSSANAYLLSLTHELLPFLFTLLYWGSKFWQNDWLGNLFKQATGIMWRSWALNIYLGRPHLHALGQKQGT